MRQGATARLSFNLTAGAASVPPAGFWTDGHLQCTTGGAAQAFLAEPDFTTVEPTTVSTRGWIAWYTPASGWHWYGNLGENAARWDTWTATPHRHRPVPPRRRVDADAVDVGPDRLPGRPGHRRHRRLRDRLLGRRAPDVPWQYVNAGITGPSPPAREPVLRLSVS